MGFVKSFARNAVFPLLLAVKLDKILGLGLKRRCIIANFHGVTDLAGHRFNNRHLDAREFEKLLIYFKANFNVVPLREIFEIHRQGKSPDKKTIALTFDDGYLNNFTCALPLLKKHNVPATFYLITKGLAENDYYVWPDIIDLILRSVKEDIQLDAGLFKYPGFFCAELGKNLSDFMKSCGAIREKYIDQLSKKYPVYKQVAKEFPQLIELIRGEQISAYAKEPLLELASHSHTHFNLEYLTNDECAFEVKESKRIIEKHIQKQVISIAFPDGSYNEKTLQICKEAGYINQVAVEYKMNEGNSNKDLLSRYTISNSTTAASNIIRLALQYRKYAF